MKKTQDPYDTAMDLADKFLPDVRETFLEMFIHLKKQFPEENDYELFQMIGSSLGFLAGETVGVDFPEEKPINPFEVVKPEKEIN